MRDLGVVKCILAHLDGSNQTLYKFTIAIFMVFSSEHNAGNLIKEVGMDVSCGSQSREQEFIQALGGET